MVAETTKTFYDEKTVTGLKSPSNLFDVKKIVGKGTYGSVYQAIHKKTNFLVAIKVLSMNQKNLEENRIELEILRKHSNHINISKLFGVFVRWDKGSLRKPDLWIVMEFCGANIFDILKSHLLQLKIMPESWCIYFLKGILRALEYIHSKGIIHRDIKSQNVMLSYEGIVKLVDFGVSSIATKLKPMTRGFIGTPYWMAPEVCLCQVNKDIKYDYRSDIWSVGITAIEIVDGTISYSKLGILEVFKAIPILKPPKLNSRLSRSSNYNNFIKNCLVKDYLVRPNATKLLNDKLFLNCKDEEPVVIAKIIKKIYKRPITKNEVIKNVIDAYNTSTKVAEQIMEDCGLVISHETNNQVKEKDPYENIQIREQNIDKPKNSMIKNSIIPVIHHMKRIAKLNNKEKISLSENDECKEINGKGTKKMELNSKNQINNKLTSPMNKQDIQKFSKKVESIIEVSYPLESLSSSDNCPTKLLSINKKKGQNSFLPNYKLEEIKMQEGMSIHCGFFYNDSLLLLGTSEGLCGMNIPFTKKVGIIDKSGSYYEMKYNPILSFLTVIIGNNKKCFAFTINSKNINTFDDLRFFKLGPTHLSLKFEKCTHLSESVLCNGKIYFSVSTPDHYWLLNADNKNRNFAIINKFRLDDSNITKNFAFKDSDNILKIFAAYSNLIYYIEIKNGCNPKINTIHATGNLIAGVEINGNYFFFGEKFIVEIGFDHDTGNPEIARFNKEKGKNVCLTNSKRLILIKNEKFFIKDLFSTKDGDEIKVNCEFGENGAKNIKLLAQNDKNILLCNGKNSLFELISNAEKA